METNKSQNLYADFVVSPQTETAIVLLISQIMAQVDEVSYMLSRGLSARISRFLLREMCSVLPELPPDLQNLYFEQLLILCADKYYASQTAFTEQSVCASVPTKVQLINRLKVELQMASGFC